MSGCKTREENAAGLAREEGARAGRRPLMIDDRERDTIIAALRLWQRLGWDLGEDGPEWDIAVNGRDETDDPCLTKEEIDELIEERVNA